MTAGQTRGVDDALVLALRAGDEKAFRQVVQSHNAAMLRLASMYVPSRAVAEEVVQETWLAVIKGIDRFEGRSSFRTWIFRIVANQARSRGVRERRSVPFTSVGPAEEGHGEGDLEPGRFRPASNRWPGHWTEAPRSWPDPSEHVERGQ